MRNGEKFKLDFIGIGANKSGTTWLANCLREHPEVCLSEPKEVNYFNSYQTWHMNINKNHSKPFSWYISHFRHCQFEKVKGEFSPSYLYDEKAPSLIKRCFPKIKLIVSLRNPIDRAYSSYWMRRNYFKSENRTFEEAIRDEKQYILRGFYHQHLQRYLEFFSRDQILILRLDDILTRPEEQLKRVFKFLNVNENIKINSNQLRKKANPAKKIKFRSLIPIMDISQRLLIDLRLSSLSLILREIGVTSLIMKINTVPFRYPDMNPMTRQYLRDVFKDDIRKLEILLNRDLSHWE